MRAENKFFSKHFYKKWLKEANPKIKDWLKKETTYLENNIRPGSKILDFGCGFGRHMKLLARSAKKVVGIDINIDMIKKAKANLHKFKNVELFVQDAKKLGFPSNSFDYVICMTNTFGNIPEIQLRAVREMKRVCKKNGRILISVYSSNALEIRKKDYKKVGLHITYIKGIKEDGIIYTREGLVSEQFTKPLLQRIFEKAGIKNKIFELNSISFLCVLTK